jgi:AraC family transcriptional regulator
MLWQEAVATYTPSVPASSCRECRSTSGEKLSQRRLRGFTLQQVRYAPGSDLSPHYHDRSFISLVVDGMYRESYGGEFTDSVPGTLRFLPAGITHSNHFSRETRCLLVEIQPEVLAHVRDASRPLDRPGEIQGVPAAWLANRLLQEFQGQDPASSLALEGMLLEILAEGSRSLNAKYTGPQPRWLRSARDYLEARFLEDIRLGEVANMAGVHPVHLAREFRRHYNSSIGEFVRARRIAHASRLLAHSETPIADIAINCGFSDQSHFSSVFKRQMGVTPAKFREAS